MYLNIKFQLKSVSQLSWNGYLYFPASGPQFVFTGPGPQFVSTGPGPNLYLTALAPNLCLPALASNLFFTSSGQDFTTTTTATCTIVAKSTKSIKWPLKDIWWKSQVLFQ